MQQTLSVDECHICGNNDFIPLIHLKKFPVLNCPIDRKLKAKIRRLKLPDSVPLKMDGCRYCGVTPPLKIVPSLIRVPLHNADERRTGMKKTRYTESQIIRVLNEVEGGRKVKDICREYGISDATYYNMVAIPFEKTV